MVKYGTYASGAIWWANLQLMQLVPSGGQIWNQYASGAIWWPNLQPIQEVSLKSILKYLT